MFPAMVDPTAGPATRASATALAARKPDLRGSRVGLLANVKRNAEQFLDEVGALLRREHGAAEVVRRKKMSITDPVPPEILGELVAECDVVVVGVGDCGSCSASAVADGLALEAAGVPAAVVCTEAFKVSADAMAALQGTPGYHYVRIPHPVAPLTAGELRERAATALPEIVATLTTAHPGIAA
ncbi:MAG: hypothetical protein IRZ05_00895 [Micromonosporaceae bacterium]|jgi:hypothetical protein|nr:hypothetical protein [Micromonosporaceae bacterium]